MSYFKVILIESINYCTLNGGVEATVGLVAPDYSFIYYNLEIPV